MRRLGCGFFLLAVASVMILTALADIFWWAGFGLWALL